MSEEVEPHILKRYTLLKKVGSGAYGHVWRVSQGKEGKILALKKIFDAFQHSTDAQRTYRQIVFLEELSHPNIIKLLNVIRADNDKDLYLVFEFMEADLHNAIGQRILKDVHNRFILYQITKGILFMHSAGLIHRDMKPSNVLINCDCTVKICDLGLARSLVTDSRYEDVVLTEEVATRWYRAPQVLLGSQNYDRPADIWSLGCILAEMLTGKPFLPGSSTLNQLQKIVNFTGRPRREDIDALNSQVAQTMIDSIPETKRRAINDFFSPDMPIEGVDLICKMLRFNPDQRPTAIEILSHPYLVKFRNPAEEILNKKQIQPPISDNKKLNLKEYRNMIYDRIALLYPTVMGKQYLPIDQKGHERKEQIEQSTKIKNNNLFTKDQENRQSKSCKSTKSLLASQEKKVWQTQIYQHRQQPFNPICTYSGVSQQIPSSIYYKGMPQPKATSAYHSFHSNSSQNLQNKQLTRMSLHQSNDSDLKPKKSLKELVTNKRQQIFRAKQILTQHPMKSYKSNTLQTYCGPAKQNKQYWSTLKQRRQH